VAELIFPEIYTDEYKWLRYVIVYGACALALCGCILNDSGKDYDEIGDRYPTFKWILIIMGLGLCCVLHPCIGIPIAVFAPSILGRAFAIFGAKPKSNDDEPIE
tara:strand:+ start:1228 stop:1539 length:312 start_codon:yes stop_codon:yes gene_type:complete